MTKVGLLVGRNFSKGVVENLLLIKELSNGLLNSNMYFACYIFTAVKRYKLCVHVANTKPIMCILCIIMVRFYQLKTGFLLNGGKTGFSLEKMNWQNSFSHLNLSRFCINLTPHFLMLQYVVHSFTFFEIYNFWQQWSQWCWYWWMKLITDSV